MLATPTPPTVAGTNHNQRAASPARTLVQNATPALHKCTRRTYNTARMLVSKAQRARHNTNSSYTNTTLHPLLVVCGLGVARTVFMGVYKCDVTHAAYALLCGNDESNQCTRSATEYTEEGFTFSRNGRARKPASSAAAHTHQQTAE